VGHDNRDRALEVVISLSEDPQPDAVPEAPIPEAPIPDAPVPGAPTGSEVKLPEKTRLSDVVASHLSDQARQTSQAAKARRVASTNGEPGVLDLTPLRELLAELVEELQKVRPRERIARALRDAADTIDPPHR
jgi:hypothetical protein